jgi:hypothetical protein
MSDKKTKVRDKYKKLANSKTPASKRKPSRNFEYAKPNTIAPF